MTTPLTVTGIARVCHELNRAYCEALGDHSQVPWDEAPANIRASAIDGVKFHLENPAATPEGSHENWLKGKQADGWKFGTVKDAEKKEHPCFVPYWQLPVEQRAKDYIFKAAVTQLAPYANLARRRQSPRETDAT